jgi:hypothetical protein
MINQLIRKYIKNYAVQLSESALLSEADKKWESPYIPAFDTRIGMKVDNAAQSAGAITGLPVISKRTRKGTYTESELNELVKQVFEKAAKKNFPDKYNPKTTLFIYYKALDKTNKKVWNVWAIDKNETGINQLSEEIKQILQKTTYFTQTKQQIDKIQAVPLMTLDQANSWFTYLEESSKKFNLSSKLNLPKLDKIKTDIVGDDTQEDLASQDVEIRRTEDDKYDVYNMAGKLLYSNVDTKFFEGEAKMSVSADGESLIFQPIYGTQSIRELRINRSGTFTGEYKDGMPYKGYTEYYSATNDQIKNFDGELESKVYTKSGRQNFEFSKIKGIATYGNGIIFDGDFKDNMPFSGRVFNKNEQAIGQYVNGEYKSGISYPQDLNINIDGKLNKFIVYKLDNILYVYDQQAKVWGKIIDKDKFEKEDLYIQDESIFDNTSSVTDAATIKKLNNKFIPNADDILTPGPEDQPTPPPAPKPTPKPAAKKKYIVFTTNTANIYELEGSEFVLYQADVPAGPKDKTTGYLLLGTKTAKIKGGSSTQYKMYKAKIKDENGTDLTVYVPSRFVKIVER